MLYYVPSISQPKPIRVLNQHRLKNELLDKKNIVLKSLVLKKKRDPPSFFQGTPRLLNFSSRKINNSQGSKLVTIATFFLSLDKTRACFQAQ